MEITLPDGRKATVLNQVTKDHTKIRLEDGREVYWPTAKIPIPPKEGEDTFKVVIVPAIDRLSELVKDRRVLGDLLPVNLFTDEFNYKYNELYDQLSEEAVKEFSKKWGLI